MYDAGFENLKSLQCSGQHTECKKRVGRTFNRYVMRANNSET
jgi:hypothetical protein